MDTANTEKNELMLEATGLVKTYKQRRVVDGVSIQVRAGEIVGLLGPNGAGKTTSFYMVMGLIKPNAGKITFRGIDVTDMPMYQRARLGMGYLAQEPSIFKKLTVEENVMAILETLDISRAERKKRCKYFLHLLGLDACSRKIDGKDVIVDLSPQKAMTLSGGERRRLEITRSLVTNPSFIMLDEPFAGVDPKNVQEVQQIILRLKEERNMAILITDHNVHDTLKVVDRAYLMCDGEVKMEGSSEFLVNSEEARELYLGPAFQM